METQTEATMDVRNDNSDQLYLGKPQLPQMLNVLTILTFIGCGLAYIGSLWGFYSSTNYEKEAAKLEELRDSSADNEFAASVLEGSLEILKKQYDHRYLLLASGLIFTTLCLFGALQMRKLKKEGFYIYTVGEIAPLIVTAVLLGFSLTGSIAILFGGVVAIIMVILYGTQLKHMK